MRTRRLLIHPPAGPPLWVRLYVQPVGPRWVAMILPDEASPPAPGQLKGAVFFADTAEEAESRAVSFLGKSVPRN